MILVFNDGTKSIIKYIKNVNNKLAFIWQNLNKTDIFILIIYMTNNKLLNKPRINIIKSLVKFNITFAIRMIIFARIRN